MSPGAARHYVTAAGLLLAALLLPARGLAQDVWLVTYGPGNDVWERFGHNALWLRDEAAGLDHTFSFGYFDMARSGFLADFARGDMQYFGAAAHAADEFAFYRERGRDIRAQRLDLSTTQFQSLHQALHAAIHPVPQHYAYDYFYYNCSTRLRDFLDQVLDGSLQRTFADAPARLNFRDHTARLTEQRLWLYTGIMLGLGPAVDPPRSVWEEMFLPAGLAEAVDGFRLDGRPLVLQREVIYAGTRFDPPDRPRGRALSYLLLGVLTAAVILLPVMRRGAGRWSRLPFRLWTLALALGGATLLFLWLGSAHEAAWRNAALLLINPLWLGLWVSHPGLRRVVAVVLAVMTACGAIILAWPGGLQYRPDLLLWLVSANLAALVAAGRREVRGSPGGPSN